MYYQCWYQTLHKACLRRQSLYTFKKSSTFMQRLHVMYIYAYPHKLNNRFNAFLSQMKINNSLLLILCIFFNFLQS